MVVLLESLRQSVLAICLRLKLGQATRSREHLAVSRNASNHAIRMIAKDVVAAIFDDCVDFACFSDWVGPMKDVERARLLGTAARFTV